MNDPEDPLTSLMEATVSQHELYQAWVDAGFTETQAFELLKIAVTEVFRGAVG